MVVTRCGRALAARWPAFAATLQRLGRLIGSLFAQQSPTPKGSPEARLDEVERWIKDATTKTTVFVNTTSDAVVNHRTRIEQLEEKIRELEKRAEPGSDQDVVAAIEKLQQTVSNPAATNGDWAAAAAGVMLSVLGAAALVMIRGLRGHLSQVLLQALATPPPTTSSLPTNPFGTAPK